MCKGKPSHIKLHISRRTFLRSALFDHLRHFESRLLSLKFTCLGLSFLNFNPFYWNGKRKNTKVPWTHFSQTLYKYFYVYALRKSEVVLNLSLQSRLELGGQSDWGEWIRQMTILASINFLQKWHVYHGSQSKKQMHNTVSVIYLRWCNLSFPNVRYVHTL